MGLAASQARMLMLFARKSDLEYRGQTINQRRLALSYQTEALGREYTDKLANRILKVKSETGELMDFISRGADGQIADNLSSVQLKLKKADGSDVNFQELLDRCDGNYAEANKLIEENIRRGTYSLVYTTQVGEHAAGSTADWRTDSAIVDDNYEQDDDLAQTVYEVEVSKLHEQDKRLEMELKNIETQHSAVQTELDAVKKVIDKNIETSFKTFG